MAEYVNVAVDAMGGDNAPAEIVKGAVEAVNADKRVKVFLVGKEPVIREELRRTAMMQSSWKSYMLKSNGQNLRWQSVGRRIPSIGQMRCFRTGSTGRYWQADR